MGRLIDTDVIEAFIKNHSCCVGTDGELLTVGEDGKWNNLLEYIPTAYDVDKVVEELVCENCESCSFLEKCAGSICCVECHNKVIEIVKQGDVSDDVCEYRITDKVVYASCNNKQIASAFCWFNECGDYKYCPYCGKKIKVVE